MHFLAHISALAPAFLPHQVPLQVSSQNLAGGELLISETAFSYKDGSQETVLSFPRNVKKAGFPVSHVHLLCGWASLWVPAEARLAVVNFGLIPYVITVKMY